MFGCRFDIRVSLTVLSVAVPVVGMTVLWCMLPAHSDDLWYDQGVRDFMAAGQSRLQALLSEMQVHAETDNLRFANVAYLLCSCVPRWVTAVLLGFCMAWGLWGLVKLSGGGIQTPLRASMLSAAYVYVLPWMAFPFSHDFALNYVPSVALCAWTAWLFCRPRTLELRAHVHDCECRPGALAYSYVAGSAPWPYISRLYARVLVSPFHYGHRGGWYSPQIGISADAAVGSRSRLGVLQILQKRQMWVR